MLKTTEGFWVPHCEDTDCGMGKFEYTCLCCDQAGVDFDIWSAFSTVVEEGGKSELECEHCQAPLTVYWNSGLGETLVMLNKDKASRKVCQLVLDYDQVETELREHKCSHSWCPHYDVGCDAAINLFNRQAELSEQMVLLAGQVLEQEIPKS